MKEEEGKEGNGAAIKCRQSGGKGAGIRDYRDMGVMSA